MCVCEKESHKYRCSQIYNYNDINPINDYKINSAEQTKNAERILSFNRQKQASLNNRKQYEKSINSNTNKTWSK